VPDLGVIMRVVFDGIHAMTLRDFRDVLMTAM
jgi:hypothetical protein